MSAVLRDYSIFEKFHFERKPVGVKFTITRPGGLERLDKKMNICEMFKEAQTRAPFYVGRGDLYCIEPFLLGMEETEPMLISGLVGARGGLYEEARANRAIYYELPKMKKDSVRYVSFSSLDQLTFDPDVSIITANVNQAQPILLCFVQMPYW
jgi:uncharacterized protein (DUF169 family)